MDWMTALTDPGSLRAQGLFLAEGRRVVERILDGAAGGPTAIVHVLTTPPAARALHLETRLPGRCTVRTPAEMEALTGFNFHRGVLAVVRRPVALTVEAVITSAVAPTSPSRDRTGSGRPVLVVLEQLVDADNVGSCFRNACAFGATGVLLDQRCPDPLYRKTVRTSSGHVLDVPWAQAPFAGILEALRTHGVTTVGLTPRGSDPSTPPPPIDVLRASLDPTPIALIVGNEGDGLSPATLAACRHLARIPMAAAADSLNVATALAVALYAVGVGG